MSDLDAVQTSPEASVGPPTTPNLRRHLIAAALSTVVPKPRGLIVVLQYRDSLFIKRIAAVGGDTIEGNGQQILLNGQPLNHTSATQSFAPVTVLSAKYFVLGDNLDMSLDSRTPSFGLVDENSIVGKELYSYRFTSTPPFPEAGSSSPGTKR